jgi:hypothetical protein
LVDGALGLEFMVSLDALIDSCGMLFGAMVYLETNKISEYKNKLLAYLLIQ